MTQGKSPDISGIKAMVILTSRTLGIKAAEIEHASNCDAKSVTETPRHIAASQALQPCNLPRPIAQRPLSSAPLVYKSSMLGPLRPVSAHSHSTDPAAPATARVAHQVTPSGLQRGSRHAAAPGKAQALRGGSAAGPGGVQVGSGGQGGAPDTPRHRVGGLVGQQVAQPAAGPGRGVGGGGGGAGGVRGVLGQGVLGALALGAAAEAHEAVAGVCLVQVAWHPGGREWPEAGWRGSVSLSSEVCA